MRKLCAVFAHPDDESFSVGGTLARYADEGVEVTLITSTSGEAGESGNVPVESNTLSVVRERELHEAAAELGVHHLRLLRLPDGGLTDRSDDLVAAISEALREVQPDVVITEDVQWITGHPDHIAVTKAVVRAFDGLGESAPLKLYQHVLPASVSPAQLRTTPDDYITATLNVEPWRERLIAALDRHRTQVSEETLERFRGFPAPWLDSYVCVRSRVPIRIPESDLFSGLTANDLPA